MKTIKVVAAIIINDNHILVAIRKKGDFKGLFEFPGGKIEANETKEEAIIREIKEELQIEISVTKELCTTEYQYPNFYLEMTSFICSSSYKEIKLVDHDEIKWLTVDKLESLEWIPADVEVVKQLKNHLKLNKLHL